jgi:nitronate monooxygenase
LITTNFTRLVGCAAPIQMAGIGGGDPALVAAVSDAGALGMLGAARTPIKALESILHALRSAVPNGRFGVNFLGPFLDPACVEIAAQGSDVVEFFYETPSAEWVRRVHDGEAFASWQVGSPEEAQAAIDAGCDLIVAQGVEAGGHVRGNTPILALLDQIGAFATIPFLAAGNMSSGVGLAAALEAGAAGVRIGTRFLTATESDAHPQYIDALLKAKASDTVLTKAFSTGWPNASHRVLQACIDAANDHDGQSVGSLAVGGLQIPLPKFHTAWPNNGASGNIAAMCHYAGQSVETVNERQTAAAIVDDTVRQAEKLLGKTTSTPNE